MTYEERLIAEGKECCIGCAAPLMGHDCSKLLIECQDKFLKAKVEDKKDEVKS